MEYFFTLGSNPTLSIAELSAIFNLNKNTKTVYELPLRLSNAFILKTDQEINAQQLIKKLGGTIKIGKIEAEVKDDNTQDILAIIKKLLKPEKGKFKFGISYYGQGKFNTKEMAMEIKKYLRVQNINSRWVTSREPTLSSVVVEQNKLTSKGMEFVLLEYDNNLLVGRSLTVQPFKELSFRDYGRPARDDRSGMLPPKLAQIMINLSGAITTDTILDPFCGSGTILTEAMLMGHENIIGSDIAERAVNDTKANIEWIKEKLEVRSKKCEIFNCDATKITKVLKPESIDVIITEPYLGPQRGKHDIKKTIQELEQLYSDSMREFRQVLKKNGRVVMVWPVFHATRNIKPITPNLHGFAIVNPIPKQLQKNNLIKLTNRNTIIYGRKGQKVWREIVVLK